jgi:FtsH-binding integral membrane protein
MFPTLLSKTFLILALSLAASYLGAYIVIEGFRRAYKRRAPYVKATRNEEGELDLQVEQAVLYRVFWPAMILNIAAFLALSALKESFPANMLLMTAFTFTEGLSLGVVLISVDENLAMRVSLLTALVTLLAGMIGWYSGVDFTVLSGGLFWALLALILVSIYSIFVQMDDFAHRVMASIGIFIFTAYLLVDFDRLKQAEATADDGWNPALSMAIHIYLDVINLFLQILKLLRHR